MTRLIFPALVFAALSLAFAPGLVVAHDLSRSESSFEVRDSEIVGTFTLDVAEFGNIDSNSDGTVSYEELDRGIGGIYAAIKAHFRVLGPQAPIGATVERYQIVDGHLLRLDLRYAFQEPVTRVEVISTLHQIARPDHRHFVSVRFGDDVRESVLGPGAETAVFDRATRPNFGTLRRFVGLGVEHIVTGYDHLAFLLCLLIATTTFSSLVAVITAFTLAHSITLALATFDLVIMPTRLTESLTALSIAYFAAENLFEGQAVRRSELTFLFGLVHGFGLSNVLRQMQLPRASLALSLFSFNLGVELGQIAFVAAAYPIVRRIATPRFRPAVSFGVGCVAVYWFVQRAFHG